MSTPSQLVIASYNILNPYHAVNYKVSEGVTFKNGVYQTNWDERLPKIVANILRMQPDILALQEINPLTLDTSRQARASTRSQHRPTQEQLDWIYWKNLKDPLKPSVEFGRAPTCFEEASDHLPIMAILSFE